ncbi:MAG: MoxR family ATPase [Clostridiales bacterium]|nr:MoxR family ATPase [Clostridiales bacterium]
MENYKPIIDNIINEVKKAVSGKDDELKKILTAIVAGGNILLDDIPGVGKTTIALAFSKALGLEVNRIYLTPDVLPTDITGFTMYNKQTDSFEYKEGVVMCNLLLADEINRTSSKTQSALLQAMEEKRVSVDGETYELPSPFIVMATQNPVGSIGTSRLPESQLDRFLIRLSLGYPDRKNEIDILKEHKERNPLDDVNRVIDKETLVEIQKAATEIFVDDKIYEKIVGLSEKTRSNPYIRMGVSPRGSISLLRMSTARALCEGRDYAVPGDLKSVFVDTCSHRIVLTSQAAAEEITAVGVLEKILKSERL